MRGVVIDTNLMLLLVVGSYKRTRIETFKRTRKYTDADFDVLLELISPFSRRIATPNILTEVDNLVRQAPEREHADIAKAFTNILTHFAEIYRPSHGFIGTPIYIKTGLTDAILVSLAEEHLILTDDFPLANRLERIGRAVINFNHLRL